jgi:thiamine pyrophosphokinase
MKGIILLNGEPYLGEIDQTDSHVICADGAYNWAKDRIKIDETVGDLDSVIGEIQPLPSVVYPSEKDQTDGEIAIERMLALRAEHKIDRVEIYGGGGGREDHFLGNLHLLYRCAKQGLPCTMYTNNSMLFAFLGGITLTGLKGETLSLLPLGGDVEIESTSGLKYSADGLTLGYGSCRGISNVVVDDKAEIVINSGVALCIVNA